MQWKSPSWFNGIASTRWKPWILCFQFIIRYSALCERTNEKVWSATNLQEFVPLWFPLTEFVCRYGPVFRTSLVGRPVIVSTNSDLNYYIFQQEGRLFQSWYPDTFTEIFGKQNVGSLHGFIYKYLKGMVLNLFGPESLRKMLTEVEQAANKSLEMWSRQETVELKDASAAVSINSLIYSHRKFAATGSVHIFT